MARKLRNEPQKLVGGIWFFSVPAMSPITVVAFWDDWSQDTSLKSWLTVSIHGVLFKRDRRRRLTFSVPGFGSKVLGSAWPFKQVGKFSGTTNTRHHLINNQRGAAVRRNPS